MARQERSREPKKKFTEKAGLLCSKCRKKTAKYTFVKIGGKLVVRCTDINYCQTTER